MPTKIGGGHQMQEYDPATGRYGCGSGGFAKNPKTVKSRLTGFEAEKKEAKRTTVKEGPYKGGSMVNRTLRDNLQELYKFYPINENKLFGKKGKSNRHGVRQIDGDDAIRTARQFYEILSYGGIEENLPNGKGVRTKLKDGTWVVYREITSTLNSPAVEINVDGSNDKCGLKYQKIHFEKRKN